MRMTCVRSIMLAIAGVLLSLGGCATSSDTGVLAGDRTAHFTEVWPGLDPADNAPVVSVEHVFTLRNRSDQPVTIVSHRTRIDTVWRFTTGDPSELPRTIEPGDTVQIAMTAKVRQPQPHRYYAELTLDTGETIPLEMFIES